MLSKIFICTYSENYYKYLKDSFKDISFFQVSYCSDIEFAKNNEFNIVHYYAIISEKIGGKPRFYESEIVKTKRKYDLVPYIVLSPAFRTDDKLTDWEFIRHQIEIPLKAVINFSKNNDSVLTYGVHTNIILGEKTYTVHDFMKIKDIFCNVLMSEKLL